MTKAEKTLRSKRAVAYLAARGVHDIHISALDHGLDEETFSLAVASGRKTPNKITDQCVSVVWPLIRYNRGAVFNCTNHECESFFIIGSHADFVRCPKCFRPSFEVLLAFNQKVEDWIFTHGGDRDFSRR